MAKPIQWYPGHMAKTRRMLEDSLKLIDVVCELIDARIPVSSRNPDINELLSGKPRVIILNRADMACPDETKRWAVHFRNQGFEVVETDAKTGAGVDSFAPAVRRAAIERLERTAGMGRTANVRAMIVGVPNVGKSSLINRIAGDRRARAEDRPGVTRSGQWFYLEGGLALLDTPGILWPRFDDPQTGMYLAYTGAIRDEIMDVECLAANLANKLAEVAPSSMEGRFGISVAGARENETEFAGGGSSLGAELLEAIGRRRGCLAAGGEVDYFRAANLLLDEYRSGRLGRITFERIGGDG